MNEKPTTNQTHEPLLFDDRDDLDEIQESDGIKATNTIVTEFSDEAKLKMEVIQSLLEPCDTFGKLR